jgi:hypothetical protein
MSDRDMEMFGAAAANLNLNQKPDSFKESLDTLKNKLLQHQQAMVNTLKTNNTGGTAKTAEDYLSKFPK